MCQIWLRSDGRECNAAMTIAKCTKTAASSNDSNHLSRTPAAWFASSTSHHERPYRNLGSYISLRSYTIVVLTPAAAGDSPLAEESGRRAKFLTSDATGGVLVAAKLTDYQIPVSNIFIIPFQMSRYLLILFVCEYRLLLCNTFDFDSLLAVIQSILELDTRVSPNANQRSRIGITPKRHV